MTYLPRITEKRIVRTLDALGAVYLRGVKASGKTATALQYAKSHINLQADENTRQLAKLSPSTVLTGDTPRLIDEWQEVPSIWNSIKVEVDNRKAKGQFILTGSATKKHDDKLHSGAGRFAVIDISTLSWAELGYSNASVSLGQLLESAPITPAQNQVGLPTILERIVIGGWPTNIGVTENEARITNESYIQLSLADDISRVAGVSRNKQNAVAVTKSIARNIATNIDIKTIAQDADITRQTASEYLNDLENLMLLVNQNAWNVHIRSKASLRTTPRRHLADPSLACALLSLSSDKLLQDLRYTGFLFESQVFHDLTIYAAENDAELYYYRDSNDNEVDIIAEKRDGSWAAFEVKLGGTPAELDEAAKKLLDFKDNIDTTKSKSPSSLNIITGTGYAFTRPDGVNVLPLSVIGA